MTISIDDMRETAVDFLSRLGSSEPCVLELAVVEGFLLSQPSASGPDGFFDDDGVVLTSALDDELLTEYLIANEDRIQEQLTYLVAEQVEGGYRARLGYEDDFTENGITWRVENRQPPVAP